MIRLLLFLISSFFFNQVSFAQNYQVGDSLYVWAVSGLNMRTTPDLKGEKIMTIPYGQRVEIKQVYGKELTLQVIQPQQLYEQNYSGFKMTGQWSKISFMDTIGYVFNGFLSRFSTVEISKRNNKTEIYPVENLTTWAGRNFSILKTIEFKDTLNNFYESKIIYGNGLVKRNITQGVLSSQIYIIPDSSINEIFSLLNVFWRLEQNGKSPYGTEYAIHQEESNSIIGDDLGNCHFLIKELRGVIIITLDCAC